MKRFGELGVSVYVTEFDVYMSDVPAPDYAKDTIEGNIYYEMMHACIEAGDCHSFSILGITDKETWSTQRSAAVQLLRSRSQT